MSFGTLVAVLVVFVVIRALVQAAKQVKRTMDQAQGDTLQRARTRLQARAAFAGRDEASLTLEGVLKEIERVKRETERTRTIRPAPPRRPLAQVWDEAGPLGRKSRVELPSAEEVEDSESLEGPAQITNLEEDTPLEESGAVRKASRKVIPKVASRMNVAGKTPEIDSRLRQQPADHTAVRMPNVQRLREALVWREILGPPMALRDD